MKIASSHATDIGLVLGDLWDNMDKVCEEQTGWVNIGKEKNHNNKPWILAYIVESGGEKKKLKSTIIINYYYYFSFPFACFSTIYGK